MQNEVVIRTSVVEESTELKLALADLISTAPDMVCISTYSCIRAAIPGILQNPPDVVLLDLGSSGNDSVEFILGTKKNLPNTQYIVLAYRDQAFRVYPAVKAGAVGFLLKNDDASVILDAIRGIYNGLSSMSAPLARKILSHFKTCLSGFEMQSHDQQPCEREILTLLATGMTSEDVCNTLKLDRETVARCCYSVFRQLHSIQNARPAVPEFLPLNGRTGWGIQFNRLWLTGG